MICHLGSDPSVLLCSWKPHLISKVASWTCVGFSASSENERAQSWSHLPLCVCVGEVFICFYHSGYFAAFIHAWLKMTLSGLNIGHQTPAAPFFWIQLSWVENLEEVMRISPRGKETALRCPSGFCSDQCSLIFLCGTWMCFLRGWGYADPSAAWLFRSNIHSFLSLDPAAVLVRPSVCLSGYVQAQILQQ